MRSAVVRPVVLLALSSVLASGCMSDVVAPDGASLLRAGAEAMRHQRASDPKSPESGAPGPVGSVSLKVGQSGTLTAGRFTLFLHKNSLKKNATVTLTVATPDAMEAEITVTPADANDFQVPARVTADLNDRPAINMSQVTMYYWDGAWDVPNDVTVDNDARTVLCTLHQLANCRVGTVQSLVNHAAQ